MTLSIIPGKRVSLAVVLLYMSIMATAQQATGDTLDRKSFDTVVIMADGVKLSTHVFLPGTDGKYPAVLIRTPYNKELGMWVDKRFLSQGIAIVVQDVRGKFKSEGEFYPFLHERPDGLKTLRWIREQPWSNGTVAGWGASYMGYAQYSIADSLDAMAPLLAGSNIYDFVYPDGLFSLQSTFLWGYANSDGNPADLTPERVRQRLSRLPLSEAADSINFLMDWLQHEKEDDYWNNMHFTGRISAPVINIAGWYDIFLKSQIEDLHSLLTSGNPRNRLIIGPWCHGLPAYKNDYGGSKKTGNYGDMMFHYIVNVLKDKKDSVPPFLKDARLNLFIMEKNEYAGSDVWPPLETKITPYFLGTDGSLNKKLSRKSRTVSYIYDPADPYLNYGGTFLGDSVGPALQNRNLDRTDQVSFESGILKDPLTLLGPLSATLWLSSDVPCTDFIVCVQDIFPDGNIINIQEGGARIHFTGSKPEKKEIPVLATGYQLNPGHRLKVVITSSWFPRYSRSLNSCEPIFNVKAETMRKATQKIHIGPNTPSSINLPVYQARP